MLTCVTTYFTYLYLFLNSVQLPAYARLCHWLIRPFLKTEDVDIIQDVIQYNRAIKQGKPCPPSRTRREPLCQKLRIKELTWSGLDDDTKKAWARESNGNKEKIFSQFVADSKSSASNTKDRN